MICTDFFHTLYTDFNALLEQNSRINFIISYIHYVASLQALLFHPPYHITSQSKPKQTLRHAMQITKTKESQTPYHANISPFHSFISYHSHLPASARKQIKEPHIHLSQNLLSHQSHSLSTISIHREIVKSSLSNWCQVISKSRYLIKKARPEQLHRGRLHQPKHPKRAHWLRRHRSWWRWWRWR